jgi:hypothetical protein
MLILDECTRILSCPSNSLRDRLNHPIDRSKVLKELLGSKVRTTYKDRNGLFHTFFVDGLTTVGADSLQAYGRLKRPFNINVAAHFYARHKIKLHHPFLHCVVEKFKSGGEDRYYPLELLECVKEGLTQLDNSWLGHLFTDMSATGNVHLQTESGAEEANAEESNFSFAGSNDDFFSFRGDLSQQD